MTISYVTICVARNEGAHIGQVIDMVNNQTVRPRSIILVDDGSVDKTSEIAKEKGCSVVKLPHHKDSFVARPELAIRWNIGFMLSHNRYDPDYLLVIGGDHLLCRDYVERIIGRIHGTKIVAASGYIKGEHFRQTTPRGSGRVINGVWLKRSMGSAYPIQFGWEDYLSMKALIDGFEIRQFRDIETTVLRKTAERMRNMYYRGLASSVNGWFVFYRLFQSFIRLKRPHVALACLIGSLTPMPKSDIANEVYSYQRARFFRKIKARFAT